MQKGDSSFFQSGKSHAHRNAACLPPGLCYMTSTSSLLQVVQGVFQSQFVGVLFLLSIVPTEILLELFVRTLHVLFPSSRYRRWKVQLSSSYVCFKLKLPEYYSLYYKIIRTSGILSGFPRIAATNKSSTPRQRVGLCCQ